MLERSEASQKHASNVIPSERKRRDVLLRACPKKSQKIANLSFRASVSDEESQKIAK
jgi:hypothetical protein